MATLNAVGNALTGASGTGSFAGTASPTFTSPSANNFITGLTVVVTAGGTTTIGAGANYSYQFTGSTTQTVTMPNVAFFTAGQQYFIINSSTGVVTVQSSGGNTIQAMASGSSLMLTIVLTSGSTAASWSWAYFPSTTSAGLTWNNVIGTTQPAAAGFVYVATNASQTTVTLPASPALGDVVGVEGLGAAGWILAANTGQTIKLGGQTTSSAGNLSTSTSSDNCYVACIVAGTTWRVTSTNTAGLNVA